MLKIYNIIESTKTLGPFNRFALWTQGCNFNCTGCMTPDSQSLEGGQSISTEKLIQMILYTPGIEGITISGGEPFIQAESLYMIIKELRDIRDFGVIVYTGYTLKQLEEKEDKLTNLFLENIDILIDGLYDDKLNDGISLRGSSNQNVHQLTQRYTDVFDEYYGKSAREIEIHMQEENMMIVGIPKQDTLIKINSHWQ